MAPGTNKILFIHGINLRPEKLNDIRSRITSSDTILVTLSGHGSLDSTKGVSAQIWKNELRSKILEHSQGEKVSLFGYSLGGILAVTLVLEDLNLPVDKIYLIAPAICIHLSKTYSFISKFCHTFIPFPLPSLGSSRYIAHRWFYPEFYKSLFDLVRAIKNVKTIREDIQVRAVFHPRDLLVNSKASDEMLKKFFPKYSSDFSLFSKTRPIMNHLLVDEESLSKEYFEALLMDIREFFND